MPVYRTETIELPGVNTLDVACALASLAGFEGKARVYRSLCARPETTINVYHDDHIIQGEHPGYSQPQIIVTGRGYDGKDLTHYDIRFNTKLVDISLLRQIGDRIEEEYKRTGTDG